MILVGIFRNRNDNPKINSNDRKSNYNSRKKTTNFSNNTKHTTSTSTTTSKSTSVAAVLSTLVPPPVFVNVTQGKSEHMPTIINPRVLAVFQKKTDYKSRNEYMFTLEPDSEILIKWTIGVGKESVAASSVKIAGSN